MLRVANDMELMMEFNNKLQPFGITSCNINCSLMQSDAVFYLLNLIYILCNRQITNYTTNHLKIWNTTIEVILSKFNHPVFKL